MGSPRLTFNERVMLAAERAGRDEVNVLELRVVSVCERCRLHALTHHWPELRLDDPPVVSPRGVVHHADNGTTACGADGTKSGWWWAL